jgi:hypothetical protein
VADAWTKYGPRHSTRALVVPSPHVVRGQGKASALSTDAQLVRVRHVVGFAREDWGEGAWTARDLR